MRYIDAYKLIAEIERLIERANRRTDKEHLSHNSEMEKFGEDYWNGYGDLAYSLLGYIDSLQQEQPEVELEKEIQDWCKENITGVRPIYTADSLIYGLLPKTARHFYELGINARKEEMK